MNDNHWVSIRLILHYGTLCLFPGLGPLAGCISYDMLSVLVADKPIITPIIYNTFVEQKSLVQLGD